MKKITCLFLVISMILTMCVGVVAKENDSTAEVMENALKIVKQKISVPEKLTEFRTYTREDIKTNDVLYTFGWDSESGGASLEASCDKEGRITSYYFYDISLSTKKKLTSLSKQDILDFAMNFLKKTIPEAFESETDTIVFDETSWYVNNLNYSLSYTRMRDGIEVKDNNVSLNVCVCDDMPYVRNMDVYLNYDLEFEAVPADAEGYVEKYKAAFPVELIYRDDIQSYWKVGNKADKKVETLLLYRNKDNYFGYILAENGQIAEEDNLYELFGGAGGGSTNAALKNDASAEGGGREEIFTKQELEELEKIQSLISKDELKKIVEGIPYIGYDETMEMSDYRIYVHDKKYDIEASFIKSDTYQYINLCVDGVTGEVLNLRSYVPSSETSSNEELTEDEKNAANIKVDEFLNVVAREKTGFVPIAG